MNRLTHSGIKGAHRVATLSPVWLQRPQIRLEGGADVTIQHSVFEFRLRDLDQTNNVLRNLAKDGSCGWGFKGAAIGVTTLPGG